MASAPSRPGSAVGWRLPTSTQTATSISIAASAAGQRLFRNDGGTFTDVTSRSGLGAVPPDAVAVGCIAADYDNDGRLDIFVLRYGGSSLYHNEGGGHFTDVNRPQRDPAVSVSARRRPRWSTSITTAIWIWSSSAWLMSPARARASAPGS